jgi:hypothetical protein
MEQELLDTISMLSEKLSQLEKRVKAVEKATDEFKLPAFFKLSHMKEEKFLKVLNYLYINPGKAKYFKVSNENMEKLQSPDEHLEFVTNLLKFAKDSNITKYHESNDIQDLVQRYKAFEK